MTFFRRLKLYWAYFLLTHRIPMSLTSTQLDTLQSDLDALKTAVTADANADTDVSAATAALATATATKAQTAPAVTAAEAQLLSDANADFAAPAS
jgi:hypothetical protein